MGPLLRKLALNQEDATVCVISDSTGNGSTGSAIRYIYQLFNTFVKAMYPQYTVLYYTWNTGGTDYDSPTTLQTGTGSNTLRIYNGAVTGTQPAYAIGTRAPLMWVLKNPDLVIVNHGHNIGNDVVSSVLTRQLHFESSLMALVQDLRYRAPRAGIVANLQNPTTDNTYQQIRMARLSNLAIRLGIGTVDTLSAFFLADGTVNSALMADTVHPNNAGSQVQASIWAPLFSPRGTFDETLLLPPAIADVGGKGLINDPYFTRGGQGDVPQSLSNATMQPAAGGSVPFEGNSRWTMMLSPVTTGASNVVYDSTVAVARLIGQTVTFWIRLYVPTGATSGAGRIAISDGVASIVTNTQTDQAVDGWHTVSVSWTVSTGASYLRFTIYGSSGAGGTPIYISEMHAVEGGMPRLALPRPSSVAPLAALVPFSALPGYDFNGSSSQGSVPTNALFATLGTSSFGAGLVAALKAVTYATVQPLMNCFTGNTGWKLQLSTTGLIQLLIGDGSSGFTTYSSTGSISQLTSAGTPTAIAVSIVRTGFATFYVNGVQLGSSVDISAQSVQTVTNAGALQLGVDGSTFAGFVLHSVAIFNGAIDGLVYGATGLASSQKWGGTNVYTADFSAGNDSWTASNIVRTGNVDGISDGTTTLNNTLSVCPSTTASVQHATGRTSLLTPLSRVRIRIRYYIPTANTNVKGIRMFTNGGSSISSTFPDMTVTGTWTTVSVDLQLRSDMTGYSLRSIDASGSSAHVGVTGGADDLYYIAEFSITSIGASLAWEPSPAAMRGGEWRQSNTAQALTDMALTALTTNMPISETMVQTYSGTFTAPGGTRTIICDTSGGAAVVNLPAVSASRGVRYTIKQIGASGVTINRAGSDTIFSTSSVTSLSLAGTGTFVTIEADVANSRWVTV
jgi:lysophospholipase L1-like esterase